MFVFSIYHFHKLSYRSHGSGGGGGFLMNVLPVGGYSTDRSKDLVLIGSVTWKLNSLNFIDLPVFKKVKGHTSKLMFYVQIVQKEYEEIQISHAKKID